MREIERALAAGEEVRFPVPVGDTQPVVRPDAGGEGSGRQTIFVCIETADNLWLQCARGEARTTLPSRCVSWNRLTAAQRELLAPRADGEPPHVDGHLRTPGQERELKVVYVATRPVEPGGEHAEPFWAELFRGHLFDLDRHVSTAQMVERRALVEAIGFDPLHLSCPGLLDQSSPADRSLSRLYKRHVSAERFLFPAEEFRHAMAIGRVVLRPELMRGMRIGESSQARSNPGAFGLRKFDGRIFLYLSAVPKMAGSRSRWTGSPSRPSSASACWRSSVGSARTASCRCVTTTCRRGSFRRHDIYS
jgi:hypothetical protein